MAAAFAQVLPTLLHATARVTIDQRLFLEHLAERKGQGLALAPFIQGTLTETEALFLRRVLTGMPDAAAEAKP
jgi:hypothetical protein